MARPLRDELCFFCGFPNAAQKLTKTFLFSIFIFCWHFNYCKSNNLISCQRNFWTPVKKIRKWKFYKDLNRYIYHLFLVSIVCFQKMVSLALVIILFKLNISFLVLLIIFISSPLKLTSNRYHMFIYNVNYHKQAVNIMISQYISYILRLGVVL